MTVVASGDPCHAKPVLAQAVYLEVISVRLVPLFLSHYGKLKPVKWQHASATDRWQAEGEDVVVPGRGSDCALLARSVLQAYVSVADT